MSNILLRTNHEQQLSTDTSNTIFSTAVDLLRCTEPSETSTEVIGLDFGRYREGHLDAKIRLAGDVALFGDLPAVSSKRQNSRDKTRHRQ